jgi:hypothetical protein
MNSGKKSCERQLALRYATSGKRIIMVYRPSVPAALAVREQPTSGVILPVMCASRNGSEKAG